MATYLLRDLEAKIHSVENHPYQYLWFRCTQPQCQRTNHEGTHQVGWKLGPPWRVVEGSTIDDLTIEGSLRVLNDDCKGHWTLTKGVLKDE